MGGINACAVRPRPPNRRKCRGLLPPGDFKGSAEFKQLAPSTNRAYRAYLKLIEAEFGDLPVAAVDDRRVRGDFKAWRDSFAKTPRKADHAWSTLSRVLAFAKDRGLISSNPCEGGGRLYVADRTDKIWGEAEVGTFLSSAGSEMALALMLALWTGQRQGDLLRLAWSAYDGTHIRLQQSKTGRRLVLPVGQPLKLLLDRTEHRSVRDRRGNERGMKRRLSAHHEPSTSGPYRPEVDREHGRATSRARPSGGCPPVGVNIRGAPHESYARASAPRQAPRRRVLRHGHRHLPRRPADPRGARGRRPA
jgi:integrase